jgi:hypothetical protein
LSEETTGQYYSADLEASTSCLQGLLRYLAVTIDYTFYGNV